MSSLIPEGETVYQSSERVGVIFITLAALTSLTAILFLLTQKPWKKTCQSSHTTGYFLALLLANTVQSIGTVMSLKWVTHGGVISGPFCSAQGGIKQAGNVGTALWSCMISLHLFNTLFLRYRSSRLGFILVLFIGWVAVVTVVVIGPAAIQKPEKGLYFGISGTWCWITQNYPLEQAYLEYFFEFFSAGLSFILYAAILLRVRGNLLFSHGRWYLRFVPRGESWQLAIARDLLDSSMLQVAQNMVWFPVAYTVILIPITISRLTAFAGHAVPFWLTTVSDIVFNLTGFVNVLLVLGTRRLLPESGTLPEFTTPRKPVDPSLSSSGGVTPFTLTRSDTAERTRTLRSDLAQPARALSFSSRRFSLSTISSVDSQTPLR